MLLIRTVKSYELLRWQPLQCPIQDTSKLLSCSDRLETHERHWSGQHVLRKCTSSFDWEAGCMESCEILDSAAFKDQANTPLTWKMYNNFSTADYMPLHKCACFHLIIIYAKINILHFRITLSSLKTPELHCPAWKSQSSILSHLCHILFGTRDPGYVTKYSSLLIIYTNEEKKTHE
jgi:hypothetical protein